MAWFSTRLFYQQYNQNYIFYSLKIFLEDAFFNDIRYYYDLGFENIFYIQLSFEYNEENQLTIERKIEDFRRNNVALSEYKLKRSPFISKYPFSGNEELSRLMLNIHVSSSKTALRLMFLDNAIDSYFTVLFNCIIFNYLTVRSMLDSEECKSFFRSFRAYSSNKTQESLVNSRFNLKDILSSIYQINLNEILMLADSDALEICDEMRDYTDLCKDFHFKYSSSPESILYSPKEPEQLRREKSSLSENQNRILFDLLQSNSNRIGILDCNVALCAELTLTALK